MSNCCSTPPACTTSPEVFCLSNQIAALVVRDEELLTLVEDLTEVVESGSGGSSGSGSGFAAVMLFRESGAPSAFSPTGSTEADYTDAIRAALAAGDAISPLTATVAIEGRFVVPAGFPLSLYATGSNTKIKFGQDAVIDYEDPDDARLDYDIYTGPRNIKNFGPPADFRFDGSTIADCWPAWRACQNSLPPYEGNPLDWYGDVIRAGVILFPRGLYHFSQPVVIQATQQLIGMEHRVLLRFLPNIAPVAGLKTKWALNVAIGLGGSNFTHDLGIRNLVFDCYPTGNELLGGIRWGGAQNSFVEEITVAGFGAGFTAWPYTANTDFNGLHIVGITGTLGPAFHMFQSNQIQLRSISVVQHNWNVVPASSGLNMYPAINPYPAASPDDNPAVYQYGITGDGGRMPAVLLDQCRVISGNILVENCARGVLVRSSYGINVGVLEGTVDAAVTNTCLLEFKDSAFNHFGSVLGLSSAYDSLIIEQGVVRVPGSDGAGNYHQETNHHSALSVTDKVILHKQGALIRFTRPDSTQPSAEIFDLSSGNAPGNPSLTLISSEDNGASPITMIDFATNNGGAQFGYNVSVPNLYSFGAARLATTLLVVGEVTAGSFASVTTSGLVQMTEIASEIAFTRATGIAGAQRFGIKTGGADGNPSLTLIASSTGGGSPTVMFDFAIANGGAQSGYNVSLPNVFSFGTIRGQGAIRAEAGFYHGATQVVGAQGAAVANAASADATDLATAITLVNELKAQLNTLLARCRTHGLIAT